MRHHHFTALPHFWHHIDRLLPRARHSNIPCVPVRESLHVHEARWQAGRSVLEQWTPRAALLPLQRTCSVGTSRPGEAHHRSLGFHLITFSHDFLPLTTSSAFLRLSHPQHQNHVSHPCQPLDDSARDWCSCRHFQMDPHSVRHLAPIVRHPSCLLAATAFYSVWYLPSIT